jgi:tetratricopeptide (TPR) repeat protein
MEERQTLRQATKLWQEAYRYQMEGELDRAIERYQRSIEAHPTAEAHTFLGWTLSFQGRLEEGTGECLRAIAIDPEFGNPYNDIGVYLMQRDKLDESIPWFEKAKQAKRFTERATLAAARPNHPFYSGRTCPTCPPIKHANKHDPTARGCAMRCIGTSRGGCNLPLRDVTWLAAGQCPRCRAETAHGGPIPQDVDIAGALRLAAAVVEQAQKDAHQGSEAARVFLAQLHEPGNVVGGLIAVAALRQLETPTRHAKF